jgi:mono/diheme cytochrome c family protein
MSASKFMQIIGLTLCCASGIIAWSPNLELSAIYSAARPDTSAITPAMVDAGRQIFHGKGTCFACHGTNLEGGPIAPPLTAHHWKDAKGGDLDAIYYVDTHGVSGTVMVAHPGGISDADALRVASYIWSVGHHRAKP